MGTPFVEAIIIVVKQLARILAAFQTWTVKGKILGLVLLRRLKVARCMVDQAQVHLALWPFLVLRVVFARDPAV